MPAVRSLFPARALAVIDVVANQQLLAVIEYKGGWGRKLTEAEISCSARWLPALILYDKVLWARHNSQ